MWDPIISVPDRYSSYLFNHDHGLLTFLYHECFYFHGNVHNW